MAYRLPTFNLLCNIWNGSSPPAPPTIANVPCCLALGRRTNTGLAFDFEGQEIGGQMWLLLPAGTDIRDEFAPGGASLVEVGAGTLRLYEADWVDDAGAGFANEHRIASISKEGLWPVPYPRAGIPFPPPVPGVVASGSAGMGSSSLFLPCTSTGFSFLAIVSYSTNGGAIAPGVSIDGSPMTLVHNFGGITIGGETSNQEVYYLASSGISTGATLSVGQGECLFLVLYNLGLLSTLDQFNSNSFLGAGSGSLSVSAMSVAGETAFGQLLIANPPSPATWAGALTQLITPDMIQTSTVGTVWQMSLADATGVGPGAIAATYSFTGTPPTGGAKAIHTWR